MSIRITQIVNTNNNKNSVSYLTTYRFPGCFNLNANKTMNKGKLHTSPLSLDSEIYRSYRSVNTHLLVGWFRLRLNLERRPQNAEGEREAFLFVQMDQLLFFPKLKSFARIPEEQSEKEPFIYIRFTWYITSVLNEYM